MKITRRKHWTLGTIWKAETEHFRIELRLEHDDTFSADWMDANLAEEIKADLKSGKSVVFQSSLSVCLKASGVEVGHDTLCGSVYAKGETYKFIHDGYFKDMLHEACAQARKYLSMPRPYVRAAQ
jgi:hypothetical protein